MSSLLDKLRDKVEKNDNDKPVNPLFSKLKTKDNKSFNPLLKKNLEKEIKKTKEDAENKTIIEEAVDKEQSIKNDNIDEQEEIKTSTEQKEKKEVVESIKETVDDSDKETKEEVKTIRRRRRSKKNEEQEETESVKETVDDSSTTVSNKNGLLVAEYINLDIFGMKIDFEEAANIIRANYFDEEWFKYRDAVYKEFQSIKIDKDLNMGTIKVVLEEINLLKDKILLPLTEAKEIVTMLSDKDCGIGTVIKTKAAVESQTSNATARTAAGFEALQKVNANGTDINLLTILMAAKLRYNFLDAIMSNLENKRQSLITMNSALKIEAGLVQ